VTAALKEHPKNSSSATKPSDYFASQSGNMIGAGSQLYARQKRRFYVSYYF